MEREKKRMRKGMIGVCVPVWNRGGKEAQPPAPMLLRRPASPDELAQLDSLQRTRREAELTEIRRQNRGPSRPNPLTRDAGMDPRFLPLKTCFSAVKIKSFPRYSIMIFNTINIISLSNEFSPHGPVRVWLGSPLI